MVCASSGQHQLAAGGNFFCPRKKLFTLRTGKQHGLARRAKHHIPGQARPVVARDIFAESFDGD